MTPASRNTYSHNVRIYHAKDPWHQSSNASEVQFGQAAKLVCSTNVAVPVRKRELRRQLISLLSFVNLLRNFDDPYRWAGERRFP
jgi:hypothetical protein